MGGRRGGDGTNYSELQPFLELKEGRGRASQFLQVYTSMDFISVGLVMCIAHITKFEMKGRAE